MHQSAVHAVMNRAQLVTASPDDSPDPAMRSRGITGEHLPAHPPSRLREAVARGVSREHERDTRETYVW
jgi:hypothetical protein